MEGVAGCPAGVTVGVEEEFLLVDPVTGRTAPLAADVLSRVGPAPAPGAVFQTELLAGQVETASGVCRRLPELAHQLGACRRVLAGAADQVGARLVSSGTAVLDGGVPPSDGARFRRITDAYAGVTRDYQACGCHVHVGVPDPDTAVAVVNHLRPWLPSLLALSANSPYDRGRDSGYASWRAVQQARFPGSGVPPWFGSAREYQAALDRLVECGVLVDHGMTFWFARPSPHLPTVEVRAADAVIDPCEAVLQAALTRALVRTALAELAAGREAPPTDGQVAAAAVWSAARYGMAGPGVDQVLARRTPAWRLVGRLLARVAPALEETGDLAGVRAALAGVGHGGTGAERQRRAAAGQGPAGALEMLVRETRRERGEWPPGE